MRILKRNTETVLYEKVKSLRSERPDIWRCIHIELPSPSERSEPSQFTGRVACELLSNEDGYIYLCGDGDIFILFKGALMPVLRKLAVYFKDFHPKHINDTQNITVFDLGQNWEAFFELCRRRAFGDTKPIINDRHMPQPMVIQF